MQGDDAVALVIATTLRPEGNTGVHTHVRELRRHLDEGGVRSSVVTPFSWGPRLAYPVFGLRRLVVDRLSKPAGSMWSRYWHEVFLRNALQECLDKAGDCVIYAQDPMAARAALCARRGLHQKVFLAVHFRISQANELADGGGIEPDGTFFRRIRAFEREVIPRTDGIVYVSRWGRDAVLEWLPEAAAVPSAIISNFVTPVRTEPCRERLGDLVTTGRLEPAKNQRYLLQVLAEAKGAGRPLSLDVFGDGPSRRDLMRKARDLGVEEQVRFRGFRSDVRAFLPGYRAYVHAAYSESLPLAIIEAMAAGLPIVAGNSGGIAELCDDGVEARFWPLDNPAKAAAVLIGLLEDEPDRLRAARAASERFRRDFDADLVAPQLRSFLVGVASTDI